MLAAATVVVEADQSVAVALPSSSVKPEIATVSLDDGERSVTDRDLAEISDWTRSRAAAAPIVTGDAQITEDASLPVEMATTDAAVVSTAAAGAANAAD